jgi:hypothetical protein
MLDLRLVPSFEVVASHPLQFWSINRLSDIETRKHVAFCYEQLIVFLEFDLRGQRLSSVFRSATIRQRTFDSHSSETLEIPFFLVDKGAIDYTRHHIRCFFGRTVALKSNAYWKPSANRVCFFGLGDTCDPYYFLLAAVS